MFLLVSAEIVSSRRVRAAIWSSKISLWIVLKNTLVLMSRLFVEYCTLILSCWALLYPMVIIYLLGRSSSSSWLFLILLNYFEICDSFYRDTADQYILAWPYDEFYPIFALNSFLTEFLDIQSINNFVEYLVLGIFVPFS